ncbi:MAG: hypothetical protein M3O15_01110 [Acidobacteriota bacterium]|nr:hypothetical protein [Acidobacteriota bacterium]
MRTLRPVIGVLLLALTLGTPLSFASPARATAPAARERAAARGHLLHQLQSFLVGLWSAAGCEIDPLGHCRQGATAAAPQSPSLDEGCRIDPWGRCISIP